MWGNRLTHTVTHTRKWAERAKDERTDPWYDYFCKKLVGYESEPNACGRKASNSR